MLAVVKQRLIRYIDIYVQSGRQTEDLADTADAAKRIITAASNIVFVPGVVHIIYNVPDWGVVYGKISRTEHNGTVVRQPCFKPFFKSWFDIETLVNLDSTEDDCARIFDALHSNLVLATFS